MEYTRQILSAVVAGFLWIGTTTAFADIPAELPPMDDLASELEQEIHELNGNFKGEKIWKSTLCRSSYYRYKIDAKADLATVDFELNDSGSIDVYADLYDLWGQAYGRYKSGNTLCIPLAKTVGLAIDRAELFAEVRFTGTGESLKDLKVRVRGTRLGTIRLGKGVPAWLEKRVTRWVNAGLAKLWASRLGGWLSDKITDLIKDKIPVHRGMNPGFVADWDPQSKEWSARFGTLQ